MNKLYARLFCIMALFCCWTIQAKPKILVIESYQQQELWDSQYIAGLKSLLAADYQLEYFQMNTKNLPEKQHRGRGEIAWQYYLDVRPELVILGDDEALQYLGPRFAKTKLPVVYLGINHSPRTYHVDRRVNITGVLERPLLEPSVAMISQLLASKAKRVLLLFDDSHASKIIQQELFANQTSMQVAGVELELRLLNHWQAWQANVESMQQQGFDAVIFGSLEGIRDSANQYVTTEQVLTWSVAHSPVPPFSFWDFAVGENKAIGGLVVDGFEQGRLAAGLAKTILEGEPVVPRSLGPLTAAKGRYLFSRSQLARYQIQLPETIASKANYVD
ncbi:ABC transporter substrate-binding protein [Agarivorans sp. QJM3NY_25]|uniref:ABC transporter substrate-binding protein n=1 Tax=Agarivorans sp. QJM3NY_25 TaxID=3421430 RepID=UPI003D7E58F6